MKYSEEKIFQSNTGTQKLHCCSSLLTWELERVYSSSDKDTIHPFGSQHASTIFQWNTSMAMQKSAVSQNSSDVYGGNLHSQCC
jgi:hypothetical protein